MVKVEWHDVDYLHLKWHVVRRGLPPALEYAITKVQEYRIGVKLNEKHQLLFYAADVGMLGENLQTVRKKTKCDHISSLKCSTNSK